jgi:hypothetical protein
MGSTRFCRLACASSDQPKGKSSLKIHNDVVSGGSHPCARAYATNRRASAAGTIFPLRTVLIRPALKPQSSE